MYIKAAAIFGVLAIGMSVSPAQAQSKVGGCLKYGLGGAIAGHVAGGHRLKGALAGCAVGVLERRRQEQAARERNGRGRTAERPRQEQVERGPIRERAPPRRDQATSPYEDLGLDPNLRGPTGGASAPPRRQDPNAGGFGSGGTFSRGHPVDPTATGSVWPQSGKAY
jgi:hypothetical protein